jgi:acetyl esterase/lipase
VALKHAGLPQPSAAVLMSPWADLTVSSESISVKAAVDPAPPKVYAGEPSTNLGASAGSCVEQVARVSCATTNAFLASTTARALLLAKIAPRCLHARCLG